MVDVDKIIDEYNENVLEDRIAEELRKEFQSKLHEGEDSRAEISTSVDYYRVLDGKDTAEGTISAVSTLPEGTIMSIDATTRVCNIKEHDQRRKIIFNKRELLESLGLYELAATYPSDSTVELKVTVVGRDCDDSGHPIDFD